MRTKPNVLLINTDHWSSPLLGAAGHPCILTPTLDTFCKNGVRFTNAYSEHPFCIPARRTLMTGASARAHGDRVFSPTMLMPDHLPTMAQTFRDAGYQAYAVGKIHVYPQRDRIGFDDVILDDEGRSIYNVADDYDIYLGDIGHTGRQFDHGMGNNQYTYRAWHLPEATHPTNWTTRMMARMIKRRDPRRPAFWYLSYRHPHPPLVPLQAYLDVYREIPIDEPFVGEWARDARRTPLQRAGHPVARRPLWRGGGYRRAPGVLRAVHPHRAPDTHHHRHPARGEPHQRHHHLLHLGPRRHAGQRTACGPSASSTSTPPESR